MAGCWLSAIPRSCWLPCSAALVTHQSSLFLWDVLFPRSLLTTLAGFSLFPTCAISRDLFLVTQVQHTALLPCNSKTQQCHIKQLLHCLRDTKVQGPSRNVFCQCCEYTGELLLKLCCSCYVEGAVRALVGLLCSSPTAWEDLLLVLYKSVEILSLNSARTGLSCEVPSLQGKRGLLGRHH